MGGEEVSIIGVKMDEAVDVLCEALDHVKNLDDAVITEKRSDDMCNYCNSKGGNTASNPLTEEMVDFGVLGSHALGAYVFKCQKTEKTSMWLTIADKGIEFPINYCPMCGRKLN